MQTRTSRTTISFHKPFVLRNLEGLQPAGDYVVETDEELIQGISRIMYRRVATFLHLPAVSVSVYPNQIVPVDPTELEVARLTSLGLTLRNGWQMRSLHRCRTFSISKTRRIAPS